MQLEVRDMLNTLAELEIQYLTNRRKYALKFKGRSLLQWLEKN